MTSTSDSSAWPSDESPRRPARASSASSPTTLGWTASPSPVCGNTTLRHSTQFGSIASTATSTRPGKITPDGKPDPSIFSTPEDPVGIQVGTAIATLVRKSDHASAKSVDFRHLWGQHKREELTATAQQEPDTLYDNFEPNLPLGLPFASMAVAQDWSDWPSLPDLFPVSFPGVQSKRDAFLVDIEFEKLRLRLGEYFDHSISSDEISRKFPSAMKSSSGFVGLRRSDGLGAHLWPVVAL